MAYKPPTKLIHRWEAQYMNDRMTAASYTWRTDAPPTNTVCEVWHETSVILATHNGHTWRTCDGAQLPFVTHWRERRHG